MANKLFVGGIPFATTDDQLGAHFAQAGNVVSAKVITDRNTGRSRGFGFVEMGTDEEAKAAAEKFNNTDFGGRTIFVKEAYPEKERPNRDDR